MTQPPRIANSNKAPEQPGAVFVTVTIADQLFGIPVLEVQDVLGNQRIARVPLAPPEIAGSLNLRGRIVTAIDVRIKLGLPPRTEKNIMSAVVHRGEELYSLMVDKVGEVLSLPAEDYEKTPPTLEPRWQGIASGIYRLEDQLLIVLDIARLLRFDDRVPLKTTIN